MSPPRRRRLLSAKSKSENQNDLSASRIFVLEGILKEKDMAEAYRTKYVRIACWRSGLSR
jgi:hypothetical protein